MNRGVLVGLAVLVVVVGVIFLFNKNADAPETEVAIETDTATLTPNPIPTETPSTDASPEVATPQTFEVSITDDGFTPAQLTVKKGDSVKYTNNGTKASWPASAPHPTHTDYPAFDPKKGLAVGESWSFTFDQVGRWPYHNHLNPTQYGAITVE